MPATLDARASRGARTAGDPGPGSGVDGRDAPRERRVHSDTTPGGAHVSDRSLRGRQHRHPRVPDRLSRVGVDGAAPARQRDQVARARDGRRRLPGRAARDHAGARPLLGDGLRLAPLRGQAEPPAELPDRNRWENKADFFDAKDITIPFAITVFPDELYQAARSWAERAYPNNLIHYNRVDRGGHFAAWEQPQILAEELRAAFRTLRK